MCTLNLLKTRFGYIYVVADIQTQPRTQIYTHEDLLINQYANARHDGYAKCTHFAYIAQGKLNTIILKLDGEDSIRGHAMGARVPQQLNLNIK